MLLSVTFYLLVCFVINRIYISDKRMACWVSPQFQRLGGQEFRIMQDWKGAGEYDVIVLGSSHAYRGYDPREFEKYNLRMYTAGSGFQNTLSSYVLLKEVFTPQKGNIVLIDVFDQTFEGDGTGSYTRLIQNVSSGSAAAELVWRQPDIRTINSLMCRMMSDLSKVEVPDEDGYLFNGYCPKSDMLSVAPAETFKSAKFNSRFGRYLRETIRLVKSKGAVPVLVSHPQPKSNTNTKFHEDFLSFIDPFIKNENVLYLDYNTDHTLNNLEHFADANHLNQAGVTLFNQVLLEELRSHGVIQNGLN